MRPPISLEMVDSHLFSPSVTPHHPGVFTYCSQTILLFLVFDWPCGNRAFGLHDRQISQPADSRLNQKTIQSVSSYFRQEGTSYLGDDLTKLSKAIDDIAIQFRNRIDEVSKERDYLQTIFKGMAEGVLVVDERGGFLWRIMLFVNSFTFLRV